MTRKIRIGAFFSPSNNFPQLDTNVISGLCAGFARKGDIDFEVMGYEVGGNVRSLTSAVTRAFVKDRLDAVVTNVGYSVLNQFLQGVAMYRKPIFLIPSGIDTVREAELHPLLFCNSMLYWQSAWEAGRWMGERYGGNVMLVTAMLDCCCDSHAAFLEGVKQTSGAMAAVHVCDAPDYLFHGQELLEAIRRDRPDALAIYACGGMATEILSVIASDAHAAGLPQLHGPMLHQDPLRMCLGPSLAGSRCFFSWSDSLLDADTDACAEFKECWSAVSQSPADIFSIWGYETALFLRKAYEAVGTMADGPALSKVLEGMSITSPRGEIAMDEKWHATRGRVFNNELVLGDNGLRENYALVADSLPEYDDACKCIFDNHLNRWHQDYLHT